ncbi:hypothetical protein [Microvirga solisilvae]|uniref:hypothetical protein n=1 Tax=Microvirga solisilvae TaxID=2919498 RepID=UPI001FAF78B3|nr:hypothetical protein [Microvirga solisilvae]
MLIFAPESNQYPGPDGCFFASDLIFHVMCNGTWNDRIIGGLLSWALYWTFESPILISMMVAAPKKILGIGFTVLWFASLLLALSFLIRQLRKLRRKAQG